MATRNALLRRVFLLSAGVVAGSLVWFALFAATAIHAQVNNDGIAVRVLRNDNHLSSLQWYYQNIPAERQGTPAQTVVDGYPAVRDGRSVYVNAGNVSGGLLFTNIYILSYTQDAERDTEDIFNQLLKNWTFNTNLMADPGPSVCLEKATADTTSPLSYCYTDAQCGSQALFCNSAKAKVVRDVIRMGHWAELNGMLTRYRAAHGGSSPALSAGSYVRGASISAWPSWQETLGTALGEQLPVDPLNVLWDCTSPNNDGTCWDEEGQTLTGGLTLPVYNNDGYVYSYSAASGFNVSLETNYTMFAPEVPPSPNNPPEGGAITTTQSNQDITFSVSASDPDGDALVYTWDFGDGTIVEDYGSASITHTYADSNQLYNVAVVVSDGSGGVLYGNTAVFVESSNAAPTLNSLTYTISGQTVSFTAVGGSDPNGDTLSYSWNFGDGASASSGTSATTNHTYPELTTAKSYTATVTVSDGNGGSDTASVTVNVSAINTPPTVDSIEYTINEETVSFTAVGVNDPNGDTLSYSWNFGDGTSESSGTSPAISHTYPELLTNKTYTVTLTVNDGQGGSGTASAIFTIAAANTPPTVDSITYTISGQTVSFNAVGASDPNGDTLSYSWNFGDGTSESSGTSANTSHAYPALSVSKSYTVTVTVSDGNGGTDTATVAVTIPPVEAPPTVDSITYTISGQTVSFTAVGASDPNGDTLSYNWNFGDGASASSGTSATTNHAYPELGSSKNYTVTVTVSDGNGGTDTATVTFTMPAVNMPPTVNDITYTISGQTVSFTAVGASDPNGDTLSYNWNFGDGASASSGTSANTSHAYPTLPTNKTYSATVTVSDGNGGSDSVSVALTIAGVEMPPTVDSITYTISGQTVSFTAVGGSDPNGDTLSYNWNFGDGAVQSSGTSANTSHPYAEELTDKNYTVTVTVSDGNGGTDTATVTFTMPAANVPPTVDSITYSISGQDVTFTAVGGSDPNGDTLTYSWNFGNGASANSGTSAVTGYTYPQEYTDKNYTVTVTVSDGNGGSDTASVAITMPAVNVPPTFSSISYSISGQTVSLTVVGASDANGDQLSYHWDYGDGVNEYSGIDPITTHTYSPQPLDTDYTITATVIDTEGATATKSITITIPAVNMPPSIDSLTYVVVKGSQLKFTASASDPNGDTISYNWNFGDGSTAYTGITPTVLHTYPALTYTKNYTAKLVIIDGNGGSDTYSIIVSVPPALIKVTSCEATTASYNGNMGGLSGATNKCVAEFGSEWEHATFSDVNTVTYEGSYTGFAWASSGSDYPGCPGCLSCYDFTNSSGSNGGDIHSFTSGYQSARCDANYRLWCCKDEYVNVND